MGKLFPRRLLFILLCVLSLAVSCSPTSNSADDQRESRYPSDLSSYDPEIYPDAELGYFRIDPETILPELERGETDVFMPFLEDPQLAEGLSNISISWTQTDFLKIASALGQKVWDDPMNLEDWIVDSMVFQGKCQDNVMGFHNAEITYYKMVEMSGEKAYTTRHISIKPYFGVIQWGSGATYTQSSSQYWNGIDMSDAKINADEALSIADENGGREARLQVDNECGVMISLRRDNNNEYWYLEYAMIPDSLAYKFDLDTGKYDLVNTDQ